MIIGMSCPGCAVEECGRAAVKRGWCDLHYTRWRKHGDPLVVHRARKPLAIEIGAVYGRLTVVSQEGLYRERERMYLCQCSCGNRTTVPGHSLKSGNTQSCGCLRREAAAEQHTLHGHTVALSRTPTYETWRGMIRRCKPDAREREWYADRGIVVCERWSRKGGFADFLADMGERPEGLTLDRIDCDGNYEPSNCRWATNATQQLNKRPRARLADVSSLRAQVAKQQHEIDRLRSGDGGR